MFQESLTKSQRKLYLNIIPLVFGLSCLVMLVRGIGWLQTLELMVFDRMLSVRLSEPTSEEVILVGITDQDLQKYGGFPLRDTVLTQALETIESENPSAIGLDLFRETDLTNPERILLGKYFKKSQKLIGATVALNAAEELNVAAPPELNAEQVGFVDVVVDPDHKLRRMLLASRTWSGDLEYSLALRLAKAHLQRKGIDFAHGERSSDPIRFGQYSISPLTKNFGGYRDLDANGNQILLNPISASPPFRVISLSTLLSPEFDKAIFHDRVVLVGMTASSVKDSFINDAIPHTVLTEAFDHSPPFKGRVYGVEFHAHTTHQLINATLSGRPSIWVLPPWLDYGMILLAGFGGMTLGMWLRSPWKSLASLCIISVILAGISIFAIDGIGLWLPLLPVGIAFKATALMSSFVDRSLRRLYDERRSTIINTFNAVHNGPLQTLAIVKRQVSQEPCSAAEMNEFLHRLNQELRQLYSNLEVAAIEEEDRMILQSQIFLNLTQPLDQLMHQVYDETMKRPFPGFSGLQVCIAPDFSGLEKRPFRLEQKKQLCLFLEEALNNVGKHGLNSVSLDVSCIAVHRQCSLKIVNVVAPTPQSSQQSESDQQSTGRGTAQALATAKSLKGTFTRRVEGNRHICELSWPISRSFIPLELIKSASSRIKPRGHSTTAKL